MPTFSKMRNVWGEEANIKDVSPECEFVTMTLKQFIQTYTDAICDYIGDDDYFSDIEIVNHTKEIMCLVDISETKNHTMDPKMRKSLRRAGKTRREKIREKYHYTNPFNRIHAYALLENVTKDLIKDTLCINVVCTSNYSDQKGLGTFMMNYLIKKAKECGFKNIILEVGNNETLTKSEVEEEQLEPTLVLHRSQRFQNLLLDEVELRTVHTSRTVSNDAEPRALGMEPHKGSTFA